ncbi:hypothetical protein AB4Z46_26500 [Variovorax sp. M-6]|uniref:hypothetical protein n=1 Tax=Variovorax sp. M-6 TaxID=3233041 RepID=UPI003F94B4E6
MPTPGKSLLGFLAESKGIDYLQRICVPAPGADADSLAIEWRKAAAKLGQPPANAGLPDIFPLSGSQSVRLAELLRQPWLQRWTPLLGEGQFKMVEVRPLLAFQRHIDCFRADHHRSPFSEPPSLSELMDACLPLSPPSDSYQVVKAANSVLFSARSLNWRSVAAGLLEQDLAGVIIGLTLPLAHVVEYRGRYFLHNGFHRALGAASAGATHIPCFVRSVSSAEAVGISDSSGTFSEELLFSENPPTLAHYIEDRAHDVCLRIFTRSIHISWAEYAVPFE